METIETRIILDAGARNIHNVNPDALVRRTTLASVLVAARVVRSLDAGILAFKIWALPESRQHAPSVILDLANEKASTA